MSLRWRLAILLGVITAMAFVTAAYAAFWSTGKELRGETDQFLISRTLLLEDLPAREFEFDDDFRGRRPRVGQQLLARFDAIIQIIDRTGSVLLTLDQSTMLPVEPADLDVAAGGSRPLFRDVEVDGVSYRMMTTPIRGGGAVQVARDLTETEQVLAGLRNRLLLLGVAGVAVAALAGWAIARRAVKPVEALTGAAEHVAATQELAAPIEVDRTDEVGRLALSFNTMLAALETSRRQQQRLVMDASHELRTPLTSLRTNIEVLQRAEGLVPAERQRLLADVNLELEELTNLVAELVELATDRRPEEPVGEVRLDHLAEAVAERARRRTGRTITVTTVPTVVVGRASMLERAIGNLVDNADKWSPPGDPIELDVGEGRVEVRDHGPGIPEQDRPHVFDRFYRAPAARAMPGSGLGLAIVKQIVDTHEGRVWADEREGGGAVVGFEVPAEAVAAEPASAF